MNSFDYIISMKMILLSCILVNSVLIHGQNYIHEYPWNPDANGDHQIGSADLLNFLSVFGDEFGYSQPQLLSEDITTYQDWVVNVLSGEIEVDSVFFEMSLSYPIEMFQIGFETPVRDTIHFVDSGMLYPNTQGQEVDECRFRSHLTPLFRSN